MSRCHLVFHTKRSGGQTANAALPVRGRGIDDPARMARSARLARGRAWEEGVAVPTKYFCSLRRRHRRDIGAKVLPRDRRHASPVRGTVRVDRVPPEGRGALIGPNATDLLSRCTPLTFRTPRSGNRICVEQHVECAGLSSRAFRDVLRSAGLTALETDWRRTSDVASVRIAEGLLGRNSCSVATRCPSQIGPDPHQTWKKFSCRSCGLDRLKGRGTEPMS
ncbi:hypothetical protein LX81_01841 [Palleronia aestuarii]|uniref:Uncharacterized protein n=1 Tax=Palleronia aestuarii TaxID=568105 RepID=A0A2W7NZ43_9RHOB|nr:hypothetical protein LX81_01841 [Palleronia aestuarii]